MTLLCTVFGLFAWPAPWAPPWASPGAAAAEPPVPPRSANQPSAPAIRLGTGTDPAVIVLPELEVTSRRLDQARSQIQPSLGATVYDFGRGTIETLPGGDNAPLSQVLLQAPGVAQDSFGQLHVRGDHNNLQFRVNGVQLPEGLQGFGQALQTRLAYSASLITGALPAQYGFRTAGIVDITTKTGTNSPGLTVSMYGGSRGTVQPSFEYGGRQGPVDFFATGEYLHSNIGIENPENRFNARNDASNQARGFVYVSGIIDPNTRISLLSGTFYGDFRIPTIGGLQPGLGLTANGQSDFNSRAVRENQRELNSFAILSLQKQAGDVDLQASLFTRYSSLRFSPDAIGDLLFNGISQNALRQSDAYGVQTDASWRVNEFHTVRGGFLAQVERTIGRTDGQVLPTDEFGVQTTDQPARIVDKTARTGAVYGLYLQDEWRIRPTVTINYGARFDVVDEYAHDNQVSPRINVVWKPLEGTTLHAGYSRYFQQPPFELVATTSIARFLGTTAAPAVTANSTVKAERSHYFDVGISQVVLPGLTVGVDGYYKQARNLIDEGQFGAPIILTPFNYDEGQVSGIELSASYQRGPLALYGNVAYSRAIGKRIVSSQFNFDPDELAYINNRWIKLDHDQRWTGSAGAAYTVGADTRAPTRLSADLVVGSGLRASTSDVPNGRELPGYYVVNLSAVQKLDPSLLGGYGRGTELRLDVLNLLDRRYVLRDGSGVGVGNPQYGLRRAILAGISQKF